MKHLSRFSEYSMSTYLLCPRKYRYTYIEKPLNKSQKTIHVNFIFGNAVHLTCKDFYAFRAEDRTIENLHHLFRQTWKRTGIMKFFKTRDEASEMGRRGLHMLNNFFSKLGSIVPYQVEAYMEHKVRDYVLFGRIDRIDLLQNEHYEIIDYKTTKYYEVKEHERERQTIQLKLYAFLLKSLGKVVERGCYYHFEEDYYDSLDFTENSIKYIGEWFDEIVNDIRYDLNFQPNMGFHCKYCDYLNICQGENAKELDEVKILYREEPKENTLFQEEEE